ncbi:MAG: extracellular solute-binding protein [Lachnospiraceae bacterium]|nr:extracellular solute-binding protein [Lachnospiraceae bacterium]
MKKKWMSKALAMALSMTMVLGLCSCGNNSGNDDLQKENNLLAKQNVYRMEELDLPVSGDEVNIQSSICIKDKVYLIADVYHYTDGGETETVLLSMNTDGSDIRRIELEKPEPYKRPETEGSGAGSDGGNASGGAAVPLPMPREVEVKLDAAVVLPEVDMEAAIEVPIGEEEWTDPGFYENTYFGNYQFSPAGKLYGVEYYNYENYGDPNNYVYESKSSLVCWDMEGKLQWKNELTSSANGAEESWLNQLIPMKDGSLYAIFSGNGDSRSKMLIKEDGSMGEKKPINLDTTKINNMSDMVAGKDGKFLITYYDEEWTNMYIATYDLNTDQMSEGKVLPNTLTQLGFDRLIPGNDTDVVYCNTQGVWSYNIGDAEPVKIMDYVNSDIMINYMSNLTILDDEHFLGVYHGDDWSKVYTGIFTKVAPEDVPDKQVLSMGGWYISSSIKADIIEFNKTNPEYKIILKDYSQYNTNEDYMAGRTKLNNDIITGNMPDMLYLNSDFDISAYATKGLLADIGELIAKDEELSKEKYLTNVFDAYSIDGKLYQLIPSFYVQTFLSHQDIVGDVDNLSISQMQEIASKQDNAKIFQYITRDSFMYYIFTYCGRDFVDPATGTCNFDSKEFINLLEFAKTLPAEYSYDEEENYDYQTQYMGGRVLLGDFSVTNFQHIAYTLNGLFSGKANFNGFPLTEGSKSVLFSGESYAISAKSGNIDGAWSFLRQYMTKEGQEKLEWYLPVMESVLDAKSVEATQKPYWTDEFGNKQEYDNTMYVNGEEIVIPPLSQEQLDELMNFIKSVDTAGYNNTEIQNIVTEDAAAFFNGQKTAQEVATIIQSRAQIYVDENR